MAFSGFLLKMGDYTFPTEYIRADTYMPYLNMQDIDDYTDANGELHRETVDLKVAKVEFETIPMLTNAQFFEIMENLRQNYTVPKGRQGIITVYIPEYDDYVTQMGYLADFQPKIYWIKDGIIQYDPIRLAFIGGVYGGS